MTRNATNAAPANGDLHDGSVVVAEGYRAQGFQDRGAQGFQDRGAQGFQDRGAQSQRTGMRGHIALGLLIVSAMVSYGIVFVLIDKWYKGGSLGIL